jgi:hypothetical protein
MQAYKLKGTIDHTGHLVIHDYLMIPPGDVEVIVLSSEPILEGTLSLKNSSSPPKPIREIECDIPILKEWLEKTEPIPPDFDDDQAKWEYLKEKHNL